MEVSQKYQKKLFRQFYPHVDFNQIGRKTGLNM